MGLLLAGIGLGLILFGVLTLSFAPIALGIIAAGLSTL